jgi:hypothetical protein
MSKKPFTLLCRLSKGGAEEGKDSGKTLNLLVLAIAVCQGGFSRAGCRGGSGSREEHMEVKMRVVVQAARAVELNFFG